MAAPEFRFPELYDADEAAHQFYTTGVRAPLPKGWERYGRTADQWEVRGYDAGQPRKLEQLRKQEQAEQEQQQPAAPPLQDLFAMLGGPAVLLEVRPRTKKPVRTGWQKLTVEHMTPEYLAGLNGGCNIGVSLGAASRNLVTLDFDTEERWQQMLALNPCLAGTLLSTGNRGGPGLDRCHLCGRGRGGCGEGNPVLRQARRRNGEGSKRKT